MSDASERDGRPSSPDKELDATAEKAVREMLRGAFSEPEALPDLTRGVQQKLERRALRSARAESQPAGRTTTRTHNSSGPESEPVRECCGVARRNSRCACRSFAKLLD